MPITNCEISSPLFHDGGKGQLHPFEFLGQQNPDTCLDGIRVAQDVHGNRTFLAVTRQPAHALMQPHRVPGHVHVHENGATLLQIDPFAAGLRRYQESHPAGIECIGSLLTRLTDGLDLSGRVSQAVKPVITIDEGRRSEAIVTVSVFTTSA